MRGESLDRELALDVLEGRSWTATTIVHREAFPTFRNREVRRLLEELVDEGILERREPERGDVVDRWHWRLLEEGE